MLAKELSARGLAEREIAERMAVTQSAVSKYLRSRGRAEPAVLASATFRALVEKLARGLAGGTMTQIEAIGATVAAVRKEEDRGVVCTLHEEEVPGLRGLACNLCIVAEGSEIMGEQEALGDLQGALRAVDGAAWLAPLIPSVGSNLARARRGAQSAADVAAVPGRIFEMRGAARVPAAPEFGASKHVAEVVLAATRVFPKVAAALNLRADKASLGAARSIGWSLTEFDASYEGRADRIASALRGRKRAPQALYHAGAFGIEPIMYVLGATAGEVVERARALALAASG